MKILSESERMAAEHEIDKEIAALRDARERLMPDAIRRLSEVLEVLAAVLAQAKKEGETKPQYEIKVRLEA